MTAEKKIAEQHDSTMVRGKYLCTQRGPQIDAGMRRAGRPVNDAAIAKRRTDFAGYGKEKGPFPKTVWRGSHESAGKLLLVLPDSFYCFRAQLSNCEATENDSFLKDFALINNVIWLSRFTPVVVVPLTVTVTKLGLASRSAPTNAV
jgi:hypothetical protein